MDGIQSIILRLLKFVPGGIFKITYIDPNDRGSNLGELQKLYSIASSDICKKACASAEDIQKRLKELEKFVDVICAKLAGVDSIYKYNTQNEIPIEQQIVIINDYPANFERRSVETLEMLIKNSDKCGISFIFAVNKDNATDVPEDVREKFLRIEATDARISAYFNRASYSFIFDDAFRDCGVFLEKFKQIADEGVKVDNRFSNFFNLSEPPVYMDSGKSIQIPFALDNRGRLVSLELGGPLTTHALLTGFTNSGKSATLHMLINSIILNYHPDDVELWLVDYKKGEFAFYLKNPPPHIKFIALENSDEFSFSFLDMVDAEFQSRMDFLRKKGFNNIKDYKAAFGARSLPRVVLIIDEFHRLSQAAQSEPKYKQILENILREYRSCGLSCLFCDQTVTGLKGLSDAGLKQIGLRLAMYQQDQKELRETLSVDSSYYDDNLKSKINNLKQGDVIFKREAEGGDGENEQILDKYKCLFIDVNKREHDIVADYARRYLSPDYRARELIAVDGRGRREFGIDVVEKYEKNHPEITAKGIPLYAGTPTTLDSCFCFTLERKPDANILLVGSDDKLRFSILAHLIYSFKRQPDTLAVVLADENDELLHIYENFLSAICDQVVVGAEAICEVLTDYPDYYERKVKDRNAPRPKCLHVLLGLEYLAGEFARFPEFRVRPAAGSAQMIAEPPARSDSNMQSALDDLQAIRLARKARLSGEAPQSEAFVATEERTAPKPETRQEPEPPEAFQTFNCLPVIEKMINDGYRVDTYTLITYSSAKTVRQTRLFKPEKFKHKIALKMSRDDSLEFLGKADYAASLGEKNDEIQAIYYDGGNRPEKFRPYFDPEIGE
ncbi:MAG: hypothetical protein LBS00_07445 [Synergistaceae bacterium]|nr:hypothetical protein [Synergistaceae bacterium]